MSDTPIPISCKFQNELLNRIAQLHIGIGSLTLSQSGIIPAPIHIERLTQLTDGHLWLLLLHVMNHRVPLRDGSCCKAFFNTAFSTANCPQKRSKSATFASSAWVGVGSAGANAASPRLSY